MRGEILLSDNDGRADRAKLRGIFGLILIESMWKGDKNCGPPDDGEFGDSRCAGPCDDELCRRHAHWQIRKKRQDFGGEAKIGVGPPDPRLILAPRLLDDCEIAARRLRQEGNCGGDDIGHDFERLASRR